jgi:uncharacterized protein YndB with AHSA1/START domain
VRETTVSCVIDAPRERVFDYLSDLANHPEFTDHFMKDFRLERLESRGPGAAARFRLAAPPASTWVEIVLTAEERPYRILFDGCAGKLGRVRIAAEYRLTPHDTDLTRVELTFSSEPATRLDALREALGARAVIRARLRGALRRLKHVLEDGEPSAHAVRVAPG